MNLADGIILFIIAASALISVRRGFTREAFSLLTLVAAFIAARHSCHSGSIAASVAAGSSRD